jgi:4'-phosphopantetheinyl transferase
VTDGDLAAANRLLDPGERARRDRLVNARDRRDYTMAHALVRTALSASAGCAPGDWRFVATEHGKPAIVAAQAGSPPLAFNLSHTHGLVACAVGRVTLGIDVERHTRVERAPMLAERYFAGPEIAALQACATDEYAVRFIELWTLKESYIKGVGLGLSLPLHSFAFAFAGDTGLCFHHAAAVTPWHFWLAALGTDARLALAVSGDPPPGGWQVTFHKVGDGPEIRRQRASS